MKQSVVAFCIHGIGHLRVLLPVIAALGRRGCTVHVLTHADFQPLVAQAGGRFIDLFAPYPLAAVDAISRPVPSRYVTFAGMHAEALASDVAALHPALILYDTFMVVAPVVARILGVPYVNVFANHAPVAARARAALQHDRRVAIAPQCWEAVRRLREVHGISADPFSYLDMLSPHLNLYGEPQEFLADGDRRVLEPLEFFGCLAPELRDQGALAQLPRRRCKRRVYVSFGTVVWWYFEAAALKALRAIAAASSGLDIEVVISLGGHRLDRAARFGLEGSNLTVVDDIDQWAALRAADVFVTHHGINSTHEAIFHQVPMLSYPFFGDQPALAERCQQLGLAAPLAATAQGEIDPEKLCSGLQQVHRGDAGFASRLAEARTWELRTMAGRDAVIERVLAVAPAIAARG